MYSWLYSAPAVVLLIYLFAFFVNEQEITWC